MNDTLDWPEDPDASGPADPAPAARLAAQRYGALVTLDPVAARAVTAAIDELLARRPDAAVDAVTWFGVARAAAFDALATADHDRGAGGPSPATVGGAATGYRRRVVEALAVLPAAFRSAAALFHVCDLDLDTVARIEQTEPVLAAALVRGAEFVLVHAMAGTIGDLVLDAGGTVDLDWLAANLPADAEGDPVPSRAVGLGSLLSSSGDAIAPPALPRPAVSPRPPAATRPRRRRAEDRSGRARRLVGATAALVVTGGLAAALIIEGSGGAASGTPTAGRATVAVGTTETKPRPAAKRTGPTTTRAPSTTRVRPTTTTRPVTTRPDAPAPAPAPAPAAAPATTRRTPTSRPASSTTVAPPTVGPTTVVPPTTAVPTTAGPTTTVAPPTTAPPTTPPTTPSTTTPPTTPPTTAGTQAT